MPGALDAMKLCLTHTAAIFFEYVNGHKSLKLTIIVLIHHTLARLCKGDDESQWERGKFDPPPPKTPITDGHQNLCT